MPGQRWYNKAWMNLANAFAPGSPFNTSAGGSPGNAWRAGDYYRAAHGDDYAKARIAAGLLPVGLDQLATAGVNAYERNTRGFEHTPDFVGPPMDYNNVGGPPLPQYQTQYSNYGPYASGYQGLPSQPQESNPNVLDGGFAINRDGSFTGASIYDDGNSNSGYVPNSPMLPKGMTNRVPIPAWKQSASTGGGLGYGWKSADPAMVMAALGSGFVNVGAGEVADLGQMFLRRAVK